MHNIGIIAKPTPEAVALAAETVRTLREQGHNVCFDDRTGEVLEESRDACFTKSELGEKVDLLITLGGDGTLLSVARHAPHQVPIIGVNMGTLGFLTEIRVEEFPEILAQTLAGNYQSEPRVTFEVEIRNSVNRKIYRVLNDAVINKSALARIIEMWVEVSGLFVSSFRADGLIVATPTGSTAYNLSAGGPIIYPTMSAVVMTPICPHMLTHRPLVIPDTFEVEIGLANQGSEEVFLTLDGQEGFPITEKDRVLVRKSQHTVCFVQSPDKNYFDVLRQKLKWGEG
ncbi:MAG TPA: NAD(+)/NADH kinase [Thermoanaerobaculia bacterium]|nr:NAD(+)/NADH kinase [Thermoanaerobaculia bacterium]